MSAWFSRDFDRLLAAVAGVPSEQLEQRVAGEWGVPEIVAHIAGWDEELRRSVESLLEGRAPRQLLKTDDAWNAEFVAERRGRSLREVLEEARRSHEQLLQTIDDLSNEAWTDKTGHRWPSGRELTIASIFDYLYRGQSHYGGHAEEIEAFSRGLDYGS